MSLLISWLILTVAVWATASVLPGFHVKDFKGALIVSATAGRIDDELDLSVLDQIAHVRPAFRDLEHLRHCDPGSGKRVGRAGVAIIPKPSSAYSRATAITFGLSMSLTLMKTLPAIGKGAAGGHLRLRVSEAEVGIESHHFAGRTHFRAERDVDAMETDEGKDRFLHRVMFRQDFLGEAEFLRVFPAMTLAASLASGTPIALLTNGTVREARGFTSST